MMKTSLFAKTATLSSFVLLLSGFVAYRAGTFEEFLSNANPAQPERLNPAGMPIDSPPPKKVVMFPGSKAPINVIDFHADTLALPAELAEAPDSASLAADSILLEQERILYSPKSGPIFEPPAEPVKKPKRKRQKN